MQFSIQNLGLTVPTQQKAQGYFNSVGTSLGLGIRHQPLDNVPWENPGVGDYDLAKNAEENSNPTWKFGTSVRKDLKREDWPGPGGTDVPTFTKGEKTNHSKKVTLFTTKETDLNPDNLKKIRD